MFRERNAGEDLPWVEIARRIPCMFRHPVVSVPLSDPAVVRVLKSLTARALLELIRRFPGVATPTELGRVGELDFVSLRRDLDLLEEAGFIARHPIESSRREPGFSAVADAVVVRFDPTAAGEAELVEEIDRLMVEHARSVLAESHRSRPVGSGGFSFRGAIPMQLTPEQVAEMKEILHRLHRFFERVSSLQRPLETSGGEPAGFSCNYLALFEVGPVGPRVRPMAPIAFAPAKEAPVIEDLVTARRIHQLTPREKQVASALAHGRSRPEIAQQLGISINTVASIGKRVYSKLGVSRRADLAARLRG